MELGLCCNWARKYIQFKSQSSEIIWKYELRAEQHLRARSPGLVVVMIVEALQLRLEDLLVLLLRRAEGLPPQQAEAPLALRLPAPPHSGVRSV